MFRSLLLSLLIHCLAATFTAARAGVVFSDDFSYPDGPLVSVADSRWRTHSGTSGQADIISGELSLSQRRTEDVSAPFPGGALSPTNTATLFARFTVNFSSLPSGANGGYFAHFKDAAPTAGLRCRIFATTNGAASGRFRLGISAASNSITALLPQDLTLHTRYRLVCRMALATARSTLWLNPRTENDPGVTATDSASARNVSAYAFRQSLSSGSGMGELTVDNLVVTTRFEETVLSLAPWIETEPEATTAPMGGELQLTVAASGSEPLSYQWLCNGMEVPGATGPLLLFSPVTREFAGEYQVVISNPFGTVVSAPAIVTITSAPLTIQIQAIEGASIRLSWPAEPDQSYSVWSGDLDSGLNLLAADLFFATGWASFEERCSNTSRFYRVCADWGLP